MRLVQSSGFGPKMEDFNGEFLNGARAKLRRKWPDFRSRRRALQIARAMLLGVVVALITCALIYAGAQRVDMADIYDIVIIRNNRAEIATF